MASSFSSAEIFALQTDAKQYADWNENEPDVDFVQHTKNCVAFAVQNELTEKQRQYFLKYYIDRKNMQQIASEFGVNKSSVSRTLYAARKRLARVLAYTAPHLLRAKMKEGNRCMKERFGNVHK